MVKRVTNTVVVSLVVPAVLALVAGITLSGLFWIWFNDPKYFSTMKVRYLVFILPQFALAATSTVLGIVYLYQRLKKPIIVCLGVSSFCLILLGMSATLIFFYGAEYYIQAIGVSLVGVSQVLMIGIEAMYINSTYDKKVKALELETQVVEVTHTKVENRPRKMSESKPVETSPSMESLLHNPLQKIQSSETAEIITTNESTAALQQAFAEELNVPKDIPSKRSSNEPENGAETS